MQKAKLVADVLFIFEECARYMSLPFEDIRNLPQVDHFCTIPHPSGQGHMICGKKAFDRLTELATEARRAAGLQNRIQMETIRRPLADTLVRRFMNERRTVNVQQVERAMSSAAKIAKQSCSDHIYFVPCHLMYAQEPSELRVGPVIFRNRSSFQKLILKSLQRRKRECLESEHREWSRTLLGEALRYYRAFGWVAEVQIQNCDDRTSKSVATRSVTSALDCLHVVLGGGHTDKMRVGGPRLGRDRRGVLTLDVDGLLGGSLSTGGPGQVGFADGWSRVLERPDFRDILELCGVALESAVNPDLDRPISRRFLDAALWFGQGVREESRAASVVKFVTALERMLMTEERDDIGQLLAERLAAVCALSYDNRERSRDRWFAETKQAYNLRSKLVHGSISPEAADVLDGVYSCMFLAEKALMAALSMVGVKGLRAEKVGSKQLARWFRHIVREADCMDGSASILAG